MSPDLPPLRGARLRPALPFLLILVAGIGALLLARQRAGEGFGGLAAAALGAHREERQRKPNRLIGEKSPYLLQHAYNPVDWHPWGQEAFDKARREDKPIFLSIGYSTCHWCHVMERESFENDSVAALLNRWFVPVKVDREERPDVDRVYMTAMNALGLGGGWPLNVFLTPDLEPFFGGTYFPPVSMHGRAGLVDLLPRVHEAWVSDRDELARSGRLVLEALARADDTEQGRAADLDSLFDRAWRSLSSAWDREQGGLGGAPKFPSTVNLNFLIRMSARDPARRAAAREMITRQLDRMQESGIHDHLGGGFHRYATDREWLVPHFEKMLYDQAQIAWAYLEAWQVTGDERYARTARGIFRYVTRDLASPEGAFHSAEDADSEGEEGKFYVWTPAELRGTLGEEDARLFAARYGVTEAGNFERGASILHEALPLEEAARRAGVPAAEAARRLEAARAKLLEARGRRVRPHLDDKVLVSWNGLMISALARGARVLGDPALAERAERAAEFVWTRLRDPKTGGLARRWRDGEAGGAGQLDDYASLALGLLDLYSATFDPRWLERAVQLTEEQIERFWDEKDGGFFVSPAGDPSIKVRMKEDHDGAEIAGNSIAALNLQLLAVLLDRPAWREKAARTLEFHARRLASGPSAMPQMLVAMELARATPRHVVVAGRPGAPDTEAMLRMFHRRFLPHDVLLLADGGQRQERLGRLAPFVKPLHPVRGKATAYVCVDYACRLPTQDPEAFAAMLEGSAAPAPHPGENAR